MTRASLVRDRRGASSVQMLVLVVSLALAGAVSVRVLGTAVGERARCTGDEIVNMAIAPCGEAGNSGDGQAPPPPAPVEDDGPGEDGGERDEEFDVGKELLDLAADLIGFTDAKKCITEGDILACLMTALNFTPGKVFGLIFKAAKNIKRISKLVDRLLAARKAKKAKEAEEAAQRCAGGKCDKPGVCFAPGTLVHAEGGPAPIETLRRGDRVWSRDDRTGEEGYRPVVRTFVTPDQPLLAVALEGERGAVETLEVTAPHPFRVAGRGWVAAGDLQAGDEIDGAGARLRVAGVEATGRSTTVYNLEIAEFHTYFVGRGAAWVHNDCKDKKKEEEKPARKDKKTNERCKGDGDCARGHCHTKRNGEQVCVDCSPKQIGDFLGIKDRFCKNEARSCTSLGLDVDISEFTSRISNGDRCIGARRDENSKCFGGGDPGHLTAVKEAEKARATCKQKLKDKQDRDAQRGPGNPADPNAPGA